MRNWKTLGAYLSRTVKLANISPNQRLEVTELERSLVLVVFGASISTDWTLTLQRGLIAQNPLGIVIYGVNAGAAFDALISELADGVLRPHIMTGLSEEKDLESAIEGFLQATWPSEDRFDDWNDYAILNVGADPGKIEQAVSSIL